jgi:PAS domain S-box-containing protein
MAYLSEYRPGDLREGEIFYTLDFDGNFTFINRAGENVTGYSCEEARRMNVAELLTSESVKLIREQLSSALIEPFGRVYEVEILTKNGVPVVVETSAQVVFRGDRTLAIEGIAIVTDRLPDRSLRCLDPQFDFGFLR